MTNNQSFRRWLDDGISHYRVLYDGALLPSIDEDDAYEAWRQGLSSTQYANSLAPPPPPDPALQIVGAQPGHGPHLVVAMWGLTSIVILCGAINAYLYAVNNADTMRMVTYVALAVDVIACLLAFVCLFRDHLRIQGILKLGWEILARVAVYFLVIGIGNESKRVFSQGYEAGTKSGFTEGYNSGAVDQLQHDRNTLRSFGR